MSKTHWGYEYLKQAMEQERTYLDEMLSQLAPESHLALALSDMRDRLGHAQAIAAAESSKQEEFNAGAEAHGAPRRARPGLFSGLVSTLQAH